MQCMSQLLSWPNLPCALKAAIGIGKRTLAPVASLPRPRVRSKAPRPGSARQAPGPNGGVPDSLDEAKAAFRAAWGAPGHRAALQPFERPSQHRGA